jgi:hypothetical protein
MSSWLARNPFPAIQIRYVRSRTEAPALTAHNEQDNHLHYSWFLKFAGLGRG